MTFFMSWFKIYKKFYFRFGTTRCVFSFCGISLMIFVHLVLQFRVPVESCILSKWFTFLWWKRTSFWGGVCWYVRLWDQIQKISSAKINILRENSRINFSSHLSFDINELFCFSMGIWIEFSEYRAKDGIFYWQNKIQITRKQDLILTLRNWFWNSLSKYWFLPTIFSEFDLTISHTNIIDKR